MDVVENNKKNSLEKFIFVLVILNVEEKIAKILDKKYKRMENFMDADFLDLKNIYDIWELVAINIKHFFSIEYNRNQVIELLKKAVSDIYLLTDTNENDLFLIKYLLLLIQYQDQEMK